MNIYKRGKKLGGFLLISMFLLFLFNWTDQTASAITLQEDIPEEVLLDNGFRIIFDGFDYEADGTSIWRYTVVEMPGSKDLGNWVLEIPSCAPIIEAGPEPWVIADPDPNSRLSGVKWEIDKEFQQGQFWVKLGITAETGITQVAAKGPDVAWGEIAGTSCNEIEPPVEPEDTKAPTIEWVAPVLLDQRYDVQEGDIVTLVVNATDDIAIDRVRFLRWDAVNEVHVEIAIDDAFPYQTTISASELNPKWNQVYAASYDSAGNRSEWAWIWLYKNGSWLAENSVFLPTIQR